MFSLLKFSVPVCSAFLSVAASAGDPHFMPAGAGQAGMAYVCAMKSDFWSAFHNQAGLAWNRKTSLGTNYENRFGLAELGTCTSAVIIPAGSTSLGVIYSRFGCRDFRRELAGVASGIKLAPGVSAGIQIDYISEKTYGEYQSFRTITFEAGMIAAVNSNMRVGFHMFNPVPGSIRKREMISGLRFGAGIIPGKGLFTGAEIEMTTEGTVDIRTGFEYELSKEFILRGGFRSRHSSFTFGMGYRIKPASVDISFSTHDKLGMTSSVSIVFSLK